MAISLTPLIAAHSAASAAMRVFPIPPGPTNETEVPFLLAVPSANRKSIETSALRPTSATSVAALPLHGRRFSAIRFRRSKAGFPIAAALSPSSSR
jgi:hypothetical protein